MTVARHSYNRLQDGRRRRRRVLQQEGYAAGVLQDSLLAQLARIREALRAQQQKQPAANGSTSGSAAAAPIRLFVEYAEPPAATSRLDPASRATLAAVTSAVVRVLQGYLQVCGGGGCLGVCGCLEDTSWRGVRGVFTRTRPPSHTTQNGLSSTRRCAGRCSPRVCWSAPCARP